MSSRKNTGTFRKRNQSQSSSLITYKQVVTMACVPVLFVAILALDQAVGGTFIIHSESWIKPSSVEQDSEESIRSFYVEPDINGNVNGQISAIEIAGISPIEQDLEVSLIKNGDEIRTARTDMGRFVLNDVPDDETYTFIASGQNGFVAYAIRVTPRKLRLNKNIKNEQPKQQYVLAPKLRKPTFKFKKDVEIDTAAIPPTFNTLEQIVGDRLPSDIELVNAGIRSEAAPTDKSLEIAARFTYELDTDGTFSGRVVLPNGNDENREFSDLNVYLLQDDMQVSGGQSPVRPDGKFTLGNDAAPVEPGIYGLVAAGRDGFAAVSIKLVAPDSDDELTEKSQKESEYYTSVDVKEKDAEFYVPLITNPRDLMYVRDSIRQINRDRDGLGIVDSTPIDTGFGQFADTGGFIAGDGFGAPVGDTGISTRGFGSFGRLTNFDRRRLFRRALIAGAIVALSVNDGDTPTDESPSTIAQ